MSVLKRLFRRQKSYSTPSKIRYSSSQIRKPPIRESVIRSSIRSLLLGPPRRPGQTQRPVQKKPELPTGLFGKDDYVSNWQAREYLKRRAPRTHPKNPGRKIVEKERLGYEKIFKKYGLGRSGGIKVKSFNEMLKRMKKEKIQMRGGEAKKQLKRTIEYFEHISKKK